jgi:thiosulfate dehydrogenase
MTSISAVNQVAADSSSTEGAPAAHRIFSPPAESTIPNDEFGKRVWLRQQIFTHTTQAQPLVGNALGCSNCHLDAGHKANTDPLWAAFVSQEAYDVATFLDSHERPQEPRFTHSLART